MLRRRTLLRAALAAATSATGVGLYTWLVEPHWLQIVRRPLPIRGLPDSLIGKTLVQLSDIHVGPRVDDDYVVRTFMRVATLSPDIVVFTGDFISYHAEYLDQLRPVYDRVPHGRLGTYGILGNHDYGPGWRHPEIAAEIVRAMGQRGVHILRNNAVDAGGLSILGLDDIWANQFDLAGGLSQLPPDGAAIILSHNPDSVDQNEWDGYAGWILSGHTHGGQCKPPFLPPPLLPVSNRRYTAGEFALDGGRRMYISRGVGHLTQVRFNVRPEVTVFELRQGEAG
jgi:predicted MPP superfamily phosphohydrolase